MHEDASFSGKEEISESRDTLDILDEIVDSNNFLKDKITTSDLRFELIIDQKILSEGGRIKYLLFKRRLIKKLKEHSEKLKYIKAGENPGPYFAYWDCLVSAYDLYQNNKENSYILLNDNWAWRGLGESTHFTGIGNHALYGFRVGDKYVAIDQTTKGYFDFEEKRLDFFVFIANSKQDLLDQVQKIYGSNWFESNETDLDNAAFYYSKHRQTNK